MPTLGIIRGITKKQLKRTIKEELETVMAGAESFPGDGG